MRAASSDGALAERVRSLSHLLVGWPSATGTRGEADFAPRLAGLLRECAYFRAHPEDIVLVPSHGAPTTYSLVALVRGRGRRAVALAGHYDTVATDNYGDLEALACDPGALAGALIADLSGRPRSEQEERALADLAGGNFIPGRGMLDMKSGLAAAIALLERFAERQDRPGNLILLATPDEERESRGMRSLRDALPGLMARWGIDIAAGINLDVTSDQGEGALGRSIYAGTIGKLLPFALVIGQPSHAAYPFEGMSASLIGAEILAAIEGNADLCDRGAGDVSPPPICLEARDLRAGYEVTTPARYWLSFNWLYHSLSAEDLFDRFGAEVAAATDRAVRRFSSEAGRFAALTGVRQGGGIAAPRAASYQDLNPNPLMSTQRPVVAVLFNFGVCPCLKPLALAALRVLHAKCRVIVYQLRLSRPSKQSAHRIEEVSSLCWRCRSGFPAVDDVGFSDIPVLDVAGRLEYAVEDVVALASRGP